MRPIPARALDDLHGRRQNDGGHLLAPVAHAEGCRCHAAGREPCVGQFNGAISKIVRRGVVQAVDVAGRAHGAQATRGEAHLNRNAAGEYAHVTSRIVQLKCDLHAASVNVSRGGAQHAAHRGGPCEGCVLGRIEILPPLDARVESATRSRGRLAERGKRSGVDEACVTVERRLATGNVGERDGAARRQPTAVPGRHDEGDAAEQRGAAAWRLGRRHRWRGWRERLGWRRWRTQAEWR